MKSYNNILSILILCTLAMTAKVSAQVTSSIDTTAIRIGEEIIYEIAVATDSTENVTFPEQQTFLPLEVIEFYPTDTLSKDTKTTLIKKYGLTQFDSGQYVIPRQRVLINDKPFLTDSVLVEVADVVVDTTSQKMYDIKQPIAVAEPPSKIWRVLPWILLILIAIAGIVYFFLWGRRKIKESNNNSHLMKKPSVHCKCWTILNC